MEQFKIDNYFNLTKESLKIWVLDSEMSLFIINNLLLETTGIQTHTTLFEHIYNNIEEAIEVETINTRNGFKDLLKKIPFLFEVIDDQIFLIWKSEAIDICALSLLISNWDDIWYGEGDESVILYLPKKIILVINHWGEIKIKNI